jgi:hypothetical protein
VRADERVMWFRLDPTINAAGKRVLPLKIVLGFVKPEMQLAHWKRSGGRSEAASACRIYGCGAQVGPGVLRWFTSLQRRRSAAAGIHHATLEFIEVRLVDDVVFEEYVNVIFATDRMGNAKGVIREVILGIGTPHE